MCCTAGLGVARERDRKTLPDFRATFVSDQNGDERPKVLDVQCVRRGVSPLVMVAVVIGGRCRGSIGYDGAVGAV